MNSVTNETATGPPMHSRNASIPVDAESSVHRHVPGDSAVWLFVIGDMVIFSCYFAAYMYDRGQNHELFLQSQRHLSQNIGVINTLILLTSSLFVALSVQATRARDVVAASRLLTYGGACGAAFIVVKSFEWYLKVSDGYTISTSAFFMHYYMMTSLHFFHVLLGLLILVILRRELHGKTAPRVQFLQVGATYWHMVDFLWIVIFAVVYLMR
jgi:nitric oxide reductase NorE protein